MDFLLLLEGTAPSRLGDCWRRWQEKVIVLGHLRLLVRGLSSPRGDHEEHPSGLRVSLSTSLESGVLRCLAGRALRG